MQMSCWWFRRRQARREKAKLRVCLAREAAALHAVSRKDYTARTFIWDLSAWSSQKFKRRMCMTKLCFQQLLTGFVKSPSYIAAGCTDSRRITPQVWLAAAIRDLASGTTLDNVCESLGINESAYSQRREQLMQAICDACLDVAKKSLVFLRPRKAGTAWLTLFRGRSIQSLTRLVSAYAWPVMVP